MADYTGGTAEADHLCVLVHGLWGNPGHMNNIVKALRAQYSKDKLYILAAKRNIGSFTYDGIEVGGERVCLEIEEELQVIESKGGKIKKLSVVGYSLGGLVARYAIGLLHAKGVLDDLECMTFTAFASPFIGVRTPLKGWRNHIWNVLGARTLCQSGKQLFGIDKFRDTGRPLLAVLADPNSIFVSGLARFKRRILYANISNDRTAVYYTTGISKTDPYTDLSKVEVNYVPGYEDVVLDPDHPVTPGAPQHQSEIASFLPKNLIRRVPFIMALTFFLPIGIVAFLINSVVQEVRSSRRLKLHKTGVAGIKPENYHVSIWVNEIREAVEDAYEELNSSQNQEYLRASDDEAEDSEPLLGSKDDESTTEEQKLAGRQILALERKQSHAPFPTLALAPWQFEAINALDNLGWRKYPVWIHKDAHSHAAIIVRMEKATFTEGKVIFKHWLKEEFLP